MISCAQLSLKRAGQQFGRPPTGIHGRQSKHAMRAGGRQRWNERMSARLINVQFCLSLPAITAPLVAPLIQLPLHPPLAPISECGTMSYGMALQCAETAEVMDTDRMFTASCDECK